MESGDREALGRFVREHRVHYEVEPEEVGEGGKRDVVALRLRLFASSEKSRMAAPGSPISVKLQRELQAFAEHVVRGGEAARWTDVFPGRRILFQSSDAPGADEVAVVVRVRCGAPGRSRQGATEDRCLGEIRDRLAGMGVARR